MIFTVSNGAYLANAIDRGIAFQFSENSNSYARLEVFYMSQRRKEAVNECSCL